MQTVIVTGASRGIGSGIVSVLLQNNFHVIAIARNENMLKELYSNNNNVEIYPMDITKNDQLKAFKQYLNGKDIYALINNAGGLNMTAPIEHGDEHNWEECYDLNTIAPMKLSKLVIPHMKNGSTIINITSVVALRSFPTMAAYCGSKAATAVFTKILRSELSEKNIRVTDICPGMVSKDNPQHLVYTDIGESVKWILNLPSHVNIDSLSISHVKNILWSF